MFTWINLHSFYYSWSCFYTLFAAVYLSVPLPSSFYYSVRPATVFKGNRRNLGGFDNVAGSTWTEYTTNACDRRLAIISASRLAEKLVTFIENNHVVCFCRSPASADESVLLVCVLVRRIFAGLASCNPEKLNEKLLPAFPSISRIF